MNRWVGYHEIGQPINILLFKTLNQMFKLFLSDFVDMLCLQYS